MEECFSPSHTSNPSNTSPVGVALAGAELLSTNLRVGLSRSGGHSVAGVGEKGRGLAAGRPQQAKQKVREGGRERSRRVYFYWLKMAVVTLVEPRYLRPASVQISGLVK